MTKRIALFALVFVVAIAVIFTGCTPARRPYAPSNYGNTGTNTSYRTNMGMTPGSNYQRYPSLGNNWGTGNYNYGTTGYNTNYGTGMYGNRTAPNVTTAPNTTALNTDAQRADAIARDCDKIQGVRSTTAVVLGNTAYVGVDINRTAGTTNATDIKNRVAQIVKSSGQNINTVYVSENADFVQRLRNVGAGIKSGKPVNTFSTELNQMIQRLTPTRW